MPGQRGFSREDEKGKKVQVRVPAATLTKWRAYVKKHRGYLSVLIRRAVDEHLAAHAKSKKPPQLWEWPERTKLER